MCAGLVADIYQVPGTRVEADLRRYIEKHKERDS